MPTRTREFIIATDDPTLSGLYDSFSPSAKVDALAFFRGDGYYNGYRFVKTGADGNFVQVDPPDEVYVNVGDADRVPLGAAYQVRVENVATTVSTTATLIVGDSLAVITAALNTAATDISVQPFDVELIGECDYLIRIAVGTTVTFTVNEFNGIYPESDLTVSELTPPGDTRQLWRMTVNQKGLAWSTPSTAYETQADVTATQAVAGSSTAYSVQTIALDLLPIGGYGLWNAWKRQLTEITCLADTAGNRHLKVVAVLQDASGGVQIYLNNGSGGSAPTAPVGGRNVSVTYVSGDTAATIAQKIFNTIASDSALDSVAVEDATVTLSSTRTGSASGDSTFTVTRTRDARYMGAILPYNASADDIAAALDGVYTVSVIEDGSYSFTATEFGDQDAIVLTVANLVFPKGVQGLLSFDTEACTRALADSEEVTTTCQVRIKYTGESPRVVYSGSCTVGRNINRTT